MATRRSWIERGSEMREERLTGVLDSGVSTLTRRSRGRVAVLSGDQLSPTSIAAIPALAPPRARTADVWLVDLSATDARIQRLVTVLSSAERERLARFVFERDRHRFAVSHAVLRLLLASYCGRRPSEIRFAQGYGQKPRLSPNDNFGEIEFNLSHSGMRAAIAVTTGMPVGIDIEATDNAERMWRDNEKVGRWFAAAESAHLGQSPPHERPIEFLRLWTRKEAYIKGTGDGLAAPLDSFEVDIPADSPAPVHSLIGSRTPTDWWVYPFDLDRSHVGAVALRGYRWRLNWRRLRLE